MQTLSLVGQYQAAQANARYQAEYAQSQTEYAKRKYISESEIGENALLAQRTRASQDAIERKIESIKARSAAKVASSKAGVTGRSVQQLLNDFKAVEGRRRAGIKANLEASERDFDLRRAASYENLRNISERKVKGPSRLVLGLGIIGAGADTYSSYRELQDARG